ncbi:ERBB receptor feedback inhibitor 1a [Scleropages formosus]|uniref:ERBB receptor feedback inhibitor 1a n=1 Tax=Scleropages formosus TaxID=113540 RepID=A0A8C9RCW2_SCLFO|nr:ERBB receptor feedback inhibitor 1 [Scleropages formosus]
MRPDCSWSMSTAGLSTQEIRLPPGNLHLRDVANSKSSWSQHHELDNLYFSLDATAMEYNLRQHQLGSASLGLERQCSYPHTPYSPGAQRLPPKKSRPSKITLPTCTEPSTPSPPEGDQVVPSFQRLSVYERTPPHTPSRCTRPLPPLPGSVGLSLDQAVDNEVEFFTSMDDSRCLVPEPGPRPSAFRYGAPGRRSFRGCGQINYAYFEGPGVPCVPEPPEPEPEPEQPVQRVQDRPQRRLRRSHSGPAGSFNKPTAARLLAHSRPAHGQDKPEVPPRVPLPPRPVKAADHRRWSVEVSSGGYSDEDRPPKVPPREPLSSGGSRTPSPKSLPTYLNGVMPPTQSFAPDPKYVSRTLQRQHSEGSPCILPIMENGRKASTTHYFLLPQRPSYLDKLEKFLREKDSDSGCDRNMGTDCDWQGKAKPHLDLV